MISGVLLIAVIVLAALLLHQKKRLRTLAESMEDYLCEGGEPAPFSLKEDAIAPVENAASELENRIAVLQERYREECERTSSLTADISHRLKTPLSSLRLFCEMDASAHMSEQLSHTVLKLKALFCYRAQNLGNAAFSKRIQSSF